MEKDKTRVKEPLCETDERCPSVVKEDEKWKIRIDVSERFIEAFDHRPTREIACLLKIPCSEVERVISGEDLPSAEMLIAVRRVTEISIDWLLTGNGIKKPHRPPIIADYEEWARSVDYVKAEL